MTLFGWLCVLAYAWWVLWTAVVAPLKARRPKPLYKIRDGKIYRA